MVFLFSLGAEMYSLNNLSLWDSWYTKTFTFQKQTQGPKTLA